MAVSGADPDPDARKDLRVEQLRAKIEAGEYAVPPGAVADAILRHFQLRANVAHPDPQVPFEDGSI